MRGQRVFSARNIPQDSVTYYATKDMVKPDLSVVWGEGRQEAAWWRLKEMLDEEFGKQPFTKKEAYDKITSGLGLDYFETNEILDHMRKRNLLEVVRIK